MTGRCPCEEEALARIRPTPEERAHIRQIGADLIAAVERSGMARAMMVGSVARDTFIRGDRDLDVFMLFDPALPREDLEVKGLALARAVAAEFGGSCREKYAEHPYINATIDALDVDLVPCYAVERATEIQSAVDRTPFHTRYIQQRIGDLGDEVLLLKQFAKAGGVYGSDHMTEGFSGYLCELLVIHYGGFAPLLEAAATDWKPGTLIDIEGHAGRTFDEPLVVVDPVDPERNVAAALSLTRMSEFVELARGYLDDPSGAFFVPPPDPLLTGEEFLRILDLRSTKLITVTIPTPPYTADTVVPQLRKSAESIRELLERSDFVINRIDVCMRDERSMLLFELLADDLPAVRRHLGPPVWSAGNARKFVDKYADTGALSGPFIEEGRYYVEIPRQYTRAADMLRSRLLLDVALGRHIRRCMKTGWEVREGRECWDEEFSLFFAEFFRNESPLVRVRRYQRECRESTEK